MKMQLDCLSCMLRQSLEASRMAGADSETQSQILDRVLEILSGYRNYRCAPLLFSAVEQIIREETGCADPYAAVKQRDIAAAQSVLPLLRSFLEARGNSLYWALKIAATGNILDSAIYSSVDLEACLERELTQDFTLCAWPEFHSRLQTAQNILIIGDNAGEAVFDRILIERLAPRTVTYAVRSQPAINDVTLDDARAAGLESCARIVSSGCRVPGLILEQCSAEFLDIFRQADLIISKGQGNYEGLSDSCRGIFYLLKAKCPMIARAFAVPLNSYILASS
ncbi:MAG TPA: hypothetical protein DD640_00425 [Clostridiales bacterium]|nr:hypothetical protein [Clostridiales bacterium]